MIFVTFFVIIFDLCERSTSFPGSLILPPRASGKMRDPGNEVAILFGAAHTYKAHIFRLCEFAFSFGLVLTTGLFSGFGQISAQ